jgi:hypothetical protein
MRKVCLLFALALLSIQGQSFAQLNCYDISVTEIVPSASLSPCNTVNFVYTITNNSTTDAYAGGTTTIHFPLGISFSSLNSGSSSIGISTASASGSTDPVFVLPSMVANGGSLSISVDVLIPCQAGSGSSTNMDISDVLVSGNCNYPLNNTLNLLTSSLNVTDLNGGTLNLNIGDEQEIVYQLGNPGTGLISSISVSCTPDASTDLLGYCISTSPGTCGSYTNISSGVITMNSADMQSVLGTPGLGNGSSFYLHIKYKVSSCANVGTGSYIFSWGCGPGSCLPITMNTDINSIPGTPVMQVNTLSTLNNSSYCPGGQPMQLGFIYKNIGTPISGANPPPPGHTKMIDLKLYLQSIHNMGSIDPSSFRINGHPTTLPVGSVISYTIGAAGGADVFEVNLCSLTVSLFSGNSAPFGPNTLSDIDGDGYIDDLNGYNLSPNDFTLTFDYAYSITCLPEFATNAKYPGVFTQTKYQNQCHSLPATDPHSQPFSPHLSFESQYNYGSSNNGAAINAPSDVVEGESFSIELCPSAQQGWSPVNFDFNCPNGYHQFRVILPPGYHVDPSVSTITIPLFDACYNVPSSVSASVTEIAPTPSEPGYLLINHTRFPPVNCVSVNLTPRVLCFSVPMIFECVSNPLTANFGFDALTYTYEYVCDDACSTCVDEIASASTSTYHHCNGPCAKPFFTDERSFSLERTTLGWVNTPGNYDCSDLNTAAEVSPTSPGVNVQAAYPGDALHAKLSGGFAGTNSGDYQDMFLQMRYRMFSQWEAGDEEIFEQDPNIPSTIVVSGTVGADDTYLLTYMPAPVVAGNDTFIMNFSLPQTLLASLIPADTIPITFNADVHLVAKTTPFVPNLWDNTFYTHGIHKIEGLRAEFGGLATNSSDPDGHDTVLSCDSWGTRFTMYQPHAGFYTDVHHAKVSDCGLFPVSTYFLVQGALRSMSLSDFPNEHKPYAAMNDEVKITIPAGYEYVSTDFTILDNAFDPSDPNFFDNTFSAPTVTITPFDSDTGLDGSTILTYHGMGPDSCWPLLDMDYWVALASQFGITVWTKPSCDTPDSSNFFFTGGFTQAIQSYPVYQTTHQSNFLPEHFDVVHVNPTLTLTAPPTVNAFDNTVDFDFQLCNSSTHNAPYGWITFENPSNTLTLTGVTLLPNTSLSSITYGNGILVNVGSIAPSSCASIRLSATVNPAGCVTGNDPVHDEVLVTWGNECTEPMPASSETLCQQGATTFNFNRYPSALNLLTPQGFPSATVSPCSGTITYTFVIANPSLGTITDPEFWFDLPAGMSLQNADFTYPLTGGSTVTAPAPTNTYGTLSTSPGWDLNTLFSSLNTNGLTGGNTNPNNQIGVTITVQASCDYVPATELRFFTGGTSSCSQQLNPDPAQHSPVVGSNTCCFPCTAAAGMDTTICAGNNVTLTGTGNGSLLWMPEGSTNANLSVSPTETTTYTLTVTNGPSSCTDEVTVFVNTATIAATASSYTICIGQNSTLTASGGTSYSWDASQGAAPAPLYEVTVTPTVTTTYVVTGTDINGCSNTDTVTITVNPLPTIAVSADENILCAGQYANLTAGGGTSYTWDASQGTDPDPEAEVSVNPGSTTTYTVTGTDENGCSNTAMIMITVNPLPNVIAIPFSDTLCAGRSTTISATGGVTYSWTATPGPNPVPANGPGIYITPPVTTTYVVTGTDANGCQNTASVTIVVLPVPTITLSASPNPACAGQATILTANGAGANGAYTWTASQGGDPADTDNSVTVYPTSETTYSVVGTAEEGCSGAASVTVTVNPVPTITVFASKKKLCEGQSVVLTAGGGSSYTWVSAPASVLPSGSPITVSPTVTTTYTVTGSSNGCSNTATITVTVVPVPVVTASAVPAAICSGQSSTLTAYGATTYSWTPGGAGNPLTVYPTSTTVYNVTGTTDGCSGMASITVTVSPTPTITISGQDSICKGQSSTVLTATMSPAGGSYAWTSSPSTFPPLPNTYSITVSPSGNTIYTVTGTTINGCTATATYTVTVLNNISITAIATPTAVCIGSSAQLSATGANPVGTYSWTPALNNPSANGSSGTITPSNIGTYTYYVTGTNNIGCAATASVSVLVRECPCEGGTSLASSISSNPTSNNNYVLNTNTTITGNVTWDNMSVKIGTNKTITVASNATLTLTHSHLWACQNMWEGIVVQNGGRIVVATNSLIEDAKTAITVPTSTITTGYVADIRTSTFNKNHTAIRIQNCTTNVSTYPFRVADAVFTNREITFLTMPPYNSGTPWPLTSTHKAMISSGTLQEHCSVSANASGVLKAPYQNVPAQYGIYMNTVGFTTATPAYYGVVLGMADGVLHGMSNATNLYDNIVDGIYAMNTNFSTMNSVYQYMVTPPVNPASSDGTGVFAGVKGSGNYRAEVRAASGANGINRFYDNRNGVKVANYYEALISNCDVRSTQTILGNGSTGDLGFEIVSSRYRKMEVKTNLLTNIETGIVFLAPSTPTQVGPVNIDNNTIQADYAGSPTTQFVSLGIKAETVMNQSQLGAVILSTSNNTLKNVYNGIFTQNWYKQASLSLGNTISIRNNPNVFSQIGICHIANRGNNISDNIVTGPSTNVADRWIGIQSRTCSSELVSCNNVSNLSRGIEFMDVHTTPVRFMDNTIGNNRHGYVLSTNGIIGTQSGPLASTASDNRWNNPWNASYEQTFVINSDPTASVLKVRSGATYTPVFNDGSTAYSSASILNVLNPGSLRSCPAAPSSFLAGDQTAMMENIVQQTTPYVVWAAESDIINKHLVYRILKTDPSLMSGSTVLNSFYLTAQSSGIGALSSIQDDIEHDDLTTAESKILAFVPANTIESNYKNTYDVFVKSKTDTIIAPSDSTILAALAYSCPQTDGPSVFQARALRSIIYGVHIVYEDNCGSEGRLSNANTNEIQTAYLVYPNPAQDEIYIAVTNQELKEAQVEIMDITGKLLVSSRLDLEQGIGKLKLDAANGVYFITIRNSEKTKLYTQKLVIAK